MCVWERWEATFFTSIHDIYNLAYTDIKLQIYNHLHYRKEHFDLVSAKLMLLVNISTWSKLQSQTSYIQSLSSLAVFRLVYVCGKMLVSLYMYFCLFLLLLLLHIQNEICNLISFYFIFGKKDLHFELKWVVESLILLFPPSVLQRE